MSHPGKNIVILGPAYPLRGGIATFNHRLAQQLQEEGHKCSIYSFSLQYPGFLFPGKTQFSEGPAPDNLDIYTVINSVNPLNWFTVGNKIRKKRPDLLIVRYWLPFMGPALGTILRQVKKNGYTKVICIADNIIPHEKRPGDKPFTQYFVRYCDGFITMSDKVFNDLKKFTAIKPAVLHPHPLYDNFGDKVPKEVARKYLDLGNEHKIILFFGFIRQYKGLDILLQSMALLKDSEEGSKIKLLVAGEYYADEKEYLALIETYGIQQQLILRTDFIADNEVKYYFGAADVVVQPYRNATQSGVTPLAYHFEKPMIVTNVGGLPEMVPDQKVGLVVHVDAAAIAKGILDFYRQGEAYFIPYILEEKKKYSWKNFVATLFDLAAKL